MQYDVIVLGSGQAGVPLAARLAEAGRSVLLAEGGPLGGTCVNTGCTPTKTMIASARAAHVARRAGRLGVRTGDVRVDRLAVVDRKDEIVAQWQSAKERGLDYEVASMPFGRIARAVEMDEREGTCKVLIEPDTERILGAAIVGLEAAELIQIFAVVMEAGATARAIVDAQAVHPAFAEGMQTLVMRLDRYALG